MIKYHCFWLNFVVILKSEKLETLQLFSFIITLFFEWNLTNSTIKFSLRTWVCWKVPSGFCNFPNDLWKSKVLSTFSLWLPPLPCPLQPTDFRVTSVICRGLRTRVNWMQLFAQKSVSRKFFWFDFHWLVKVV